MTTAGNSGSPPTVLCPGQGAQAIGMGRAWADAAPEAAAVFDRADAILGDAGFEGPIREVCFEGPSERLNRTDVSQPAIYVTSVASWRGLCAAEGADPASRPIAAAAGLSLGEYTALHIAGSLTFEDGLRLVALRGRAMQDAAEASPSSMVAIIGASEEDAQSLCERATGQCSGAAILVPANFNAPGQVVMSGSLEACDAVERVAGEMGFKASRLAVAGAFHSPLMAPAADRLSEALEGTEIAPPRAPVLSNVTGAPHDPDAASIRRLLVDQLTCPVRWVDCARWIVENAAAAPYELAPGKTLAGLMRRIDREKKVKTHDKPG